MEVARGLPAFSEPERTHVGEELADVLIYTVRLADVCGISLGRLRAAEDRHERTEVPRRSRARPQLRHTAYMC